jgi:hypothetical protein
MSAITTHAPAVPEQQPTFREFLKEILPRIFVVPVAGPPVILLLGPWLLLVLLVIPPAALLITLVLVVAVAAGLLVALGALVASPYLLVHHLRERHAARGPQAARESGSAPVIRPAGADLAIELIPVGPRRVA